MTSPRIQYLPVSYRVRVTHVAAPYEGVHAFKVRGWTIGDLPVVYYATSPRYGVGPDAPSREAAIVALVRDNGGLVESIEGADVPSFA